jgi:hypothetical protein
MRPMKTLVGKPLGAFWALPGEHATLPLDRLVDYPILAQCLESWRSLVADGLPSQVDPLVFPRSAIAGLNLFEFDADTDDWRVRLAGRLITEHVGSELRGTGLVEAFSEADRAQVKAAIHAAVQRGQPELMRRNFVDPRGRRWSYVRLFLPFGRAGDGVDRFVTVIDPDSFGRVDPEDPGQ